MSNENHKPYIMRGFMSFEGFGRKSPNNAPGASLYFRHLGLGELYAEDLLLAGMLAARYAVNNHDAFSTLPPDDDFSPEISSEMVARNKRYIEECAKVAQDPDPKYKPCHLTVIKCVDDVMIATLVFDGKTYHLGEIAKDNVANAHNSPFDMTLIAPTSIENGEQVFHTVSGDVRAVSEITAAALSSIHIAGRFKGSTAETLAKLARAGMPNDATVKNHKGKMVCTVQVKAPSRGCVKATYVDSTGDSDYGNTLAEFMLHPIGDVYVAEQIKLETSNKNLVADLQYGLSKDAEAKAAEFTKEVKDMVKLSDLTASDISFSSFSGHARTIGSGVCVIFDDLNIGPIYASTYEQAAAVAARYADSASSEENRSLTTYKNAMVASDPEFASCSLWVHKGPRQQEVLFIISSGDVISITDHALFWASTSNNKRKHPYPQFNTTLFIAVDKTGDNNVSAELPGFNAYAACAPLTPGAVALLATCIAENAHNKLIIPAVAASEQWSIINGRSTGKFSRLQIQSPGNSHLQVSYLGHDNLATEFDLHPVMTSNNVLKFVAVQTSVDGNIITKEDPLNASDDEDLVDTSDDGSKFIDDFQYDRDFHEYTYRVVYIERGTDDYVVMVNMGHTQIYGSGPDRKSAYCAAYHNVKTRAILDMVHGYIPQPNEGVVLTESKTIGEVLGHGHMTVMIPMFIKNLGTKKR